MKDYRQYFTEIKRVNGETVTILTDDAPENLRDLVRAIHFDHFYECAPNDWIYQQIHLAFEKLALDDLEDIHNEGDIWNDDLAQWFADNCNQFANEVSLEIMQLMDGQVNNSVIDMITLAQSEAISRIYGAVNEFLEERKEVKDA